eukprot:s1226_g24.t1
MADDPAEDAVFPFGSGFGQLADDGKWKCDTCSLRWEKTVIQCKACESYQPGKKLAELPDFSRNGEVPVGDVFVHGSGECDQLGLGDDTRERRKPTLLKALVGKQICEIAVGAMHVLCVSAGGGLYSWGCNDDGALGRVSSDGSDGGPSDVEPSKVDMPNSVVVRKVSCGDCHSCALDDRGRVWLWGTYKDSNGYIGIVHKRKQEAEVLEKSAEPTLVLEGCSVIASGANHTAALVETPVGKKAVAWGSNATGQLGLPDNVGCGYAEKILSGKVEGLVACNAGGCEVSGESVARVKDANGTERNADKMTLPELQQALAQGASLIVQAPDREVPKAEKKKLLHPQDVCLSAAGVEASNVENIFASAECTFVTVNDGTVLGCGLNGDGQVGLGFASMAVQTLRPVRRVQQASWLGGNRPRDVQNPHDIEEDPEDELRPYRVSSKQLEKRFVMLADGGAQHTGQRRSRGIGGTTEAAALARAEQAEREAEVAKMEAEAAQEAARDVLRYFSGHLLSEVDSSADQLAGSCIGHICRTLCHLLRCPLLVALLGLAASALQEMEHWAPQIACLRRGTLEALLLDAAGRDERLCEAIAAQQCDLKDATPL